MLHSVARHYLAAASTPQSLLSVCEDVLATTDDCINGYALAIGLHELRHWETTLAVLGSIPLPTDPHDALRSCVMAGHCAAEMGQKDVAARWADKIWLRLETQPDLLDTSMRQLFREVYLSANRHFNEGEYDEALAVYDILVPVDPKLEHLASLFAADSAQGEDPGELSRFEAQFADGKQRALSGDLEPPELAVGMLELTGEDLSWYRGKRLLVVMARKLGVAANSRDFEMVENFQSSAREAGLEVRYFAADRLIFSARDESSERACLNELDQAIADWRPDFLAYSDLFMQQTEVGQRALPESLVRWREQFGCRCIALYFDPWTQEAKAAMGKAVGVADVMWHPSKTVVENVSADVSALTVLAPHPIAEEQFYPPAGPRSKELSFVGSSLSYNYLRSLWLLGLMKRNVSLSLSLSTQRGQSGVSYLVADEFAAMIRDASINLQFSSRNEDVRIVCGRVWEVLHSESLLLEELCLDTRQYLHPFVHYVPFSSLDELCGLVAWLKDNPQWVSEIARRGREWVKTAYSPSRMWGAVLRPLRPQR